MLIVFIALLLAPWSARGANAKPRIVVVGAGASGIAAAARLLEHGFEDIVILEAGGRIGGRIFSTEFFGGTVELGAQWCHGNKGNVVYEMVKDLDLLNDREVIKNYHYSNDAQMDMDILSKLSSILKNITRGGFGDKEISVGDLVALRYNQTIMELFKSNYNMTKFAFEYLETYMRDFLVIEGSFSWYSVSANNKYIELDGNHYNEWKLGGYRAFLNVLMKKYPDPKKQLPMDDKILFYKEVVRIIWDTKHHNCQVVCSDNSIYEADHVIFTPSIGVLKHTHKKMFSPMLPKAKISAIETFGLNATLKVFLHFPRRWWPAYNFTDFAFIWSKEDRDSLVDKFPEGPKKNGRSWLLSLARVSVVDVYNPKTLLVWFSGELVPEIELIPDHLMIKGIMYVVNKFLHKNFTDISWPDGVLHYNWFNHPNFRGTYSFETVVSRKTSISQPKQLSAPLFSSDGKMTLLFAGEATHPKYYSTVHGATETGFREAQRIINLYK